MLKTNLIRFLLFWGVWLLVPMAVDGITSLGYLWVSFRRPAIDPYAGDKNAPLTPRLVTVLVPVYNADRTLYTCLKSLAAQDYPIRLMEVICVGNAVTDRSRAEYARARKEFPNLNAAWIDLGGKGKSKALNAGIFLSRGEIVFNVDADTRLAPDAISMMVRAFNTDEKLGAASGSIQVDEVPPRDPWWWRIFNMCEVIEYLQAFRVGRRYQNYRNSMFTISGAFSAFRRDVLVRTHLYSDITVSEDTKLTFDIRAMEAGKWRIGCVEQAQAFVEPIHSLSKFMSQRLRWQRGELEVLSLYPEYYSKTPVAALGSFVGRILISDHTLAFPRLVWVFIIPFLYSLGYSLPLVAAALWLTYFMYVLIEGAFMASVNWILKEAYGHTAFQWWYLAFLMPLYRFATYWFRLAGMIYVLTEGAEWSAMTETERIRMTAREMSQRIPGLSHLVRFLRNRAGGASKSA